MTEGNYLKIIKKVTTTRKVIIMVPGIQQPIAFPALRCLPDFVKGIPMFFEILLLAEEIPVARFHENDNPYFFLLDIFLPHYLWVNVTDT